MSSARRHYRVARKEVAREKENENTVSIPKKYKKCVIAGFISFLIIVFIKGLIIGFHIGNKMCSHSGDEL